MYCNVEITGAFNQWPNYNHMGNWVVDTNYNHISFKLLVFSHVDILIKLLLNQIKKRKKVKNNNWENNVSSWYPLCLSLPLVCLFQKGFIEFCTFLYCMRIIVDLIYFSCYYIFFIISIYTNYKIKFLLPWVTIISFIHITYLNDNNFPCSLSSDKVRDNADSV